MAYHPLTNDTGQTPERRREEANDLCRMLGDSLDGMTDKERDFMESITDSQWCSPKQLFWLRDLRDKYC
jgi:hypothetical protein